jgi:hypothetical protein
MFRSFVLRENMSVDAWIETERNNNSESNVETDTDFKITIINKFIKANEIISVVDHGCEDMMLLDHLIIPRYLGLHQSQTAITNYIKNYANDPSKSFVCTHPLSNRDNAHFLKAELALCLNDSHNLASAETGKTLVSKLFNSAQKFVLIYNDMPDRETFCPAGESAENWTFVNHISEAFSEWRLIGRVKNPKTGPGFWVYRNSYLK